MTIFDERSQHQQHQQQPQWPVQQCYSLFAGADYPLAQVHREIPQLSKRCADVAAAVPSAVSLPPSAAPVRRCAPPPGFERFAKEPEERKQMAEVPPPVAADASQSILRISLPASRSQSPTDSSSPSSASSSASSSAASSRKSSFSSDRASPLLGAKPTIRLLSSEPVLAPSPLSLAPQQQQLSIRTIPSQQSSQPQQHMRGGRRGQHQRRGRQ